MSSVQWFCLFSTVNFGTRAVSRVGPARSTRTVHLRRDGGIKCYATSDAVERRGCPNRAALTRRE
jgi:hypothetical protein